MPPTAYLNPNSGEFFREIDSKIHDLGPMLDVLSEQCDKTPREVIGMLLAQMAMHVATRSSVKVDGVNVVRGDKLIKTSPRRATPTEQLNVVRDVSVHFGLIPETTSLKSLQEMISNRDPEREDPKHMIECIEQADDELGTNYAGITNELYLKLATFVLMADGSPSEKQQAFLRNLERSLSSSVLRKGATVPKSSDSQESIDILLSKLDDSFIDLEPALEILIHNVPDFQDKSVRELYNLLVAQAVLLLAAVDHTDRPKQLRLVRDIFQHFDLAPKGTALQVLNDMLSSSNKDALSTTLDLIDLMRQIDAQTGTTYATKANFICLSAAEQLFAADGRLSSRQEKCLLQFEQDMLEKVSRNTIKHQPSIDSSGPNGAIQQDVTTRIPSESLENILAEMYELIGLSKVKQDVLELVNFLKVQKLRKDKGLPATSMSKHLVFYGNPGTGKTTVARLLAKMYKNLGVVSKGQFVEADRASLVAGYLGQTAIKVHDIVAKAIGGVLFIDEAYTLCNDKQDSFGQEAIDTLLKLMEDNREDLVVIVAGYPGKMLSFVGSNPGLRSRFTKYFDFEDYAPNELLQIFNAFCKNSGFFTSKETQEQLLTMFCDMYSNRSDDFGNARDVRNLFEKSIANQANRIVRLIEVDDHVLNEIKQEDIPTTVNSIEAV